MREQAGRRVMDLPATFMVSVQLTVTKLDAHQDGRVDVEAEFCGAALRPFSIQSSPGVGFDQLKSQIVSLAIRQVGEAIEVAG